MSPNTDQGNEEIKRNLSPTQIDQKPHSIGLQNLSSPESKILGRKSYQSTFRTPNTVQQPSVTRDLSVASDPKSKTDTNKLFEQKIEDDMETILDSLIKERESRGWIDDSCYC